MNDQNFGRKPSENVPIRIERIFDSCSDKDCLSDLPVTITDGSLPTNVTVVRSRAVTVENVCVNVEPVPFNKGFFSIDLTFTFRIEIQGYERSCSSPVTLFGTAFASKNCILYGSESAVRTFTSTDNSAVSRENISSEANLPTASVSVLEPVVLETRLGRNSAEQREIFVTLGMFSVVSLSRPVTLIVPTYEYNIPRKECFTESDSPCEVFGKLKFPEEEFSPSALAGESDCCCGELDENLS